MLNSCGYKLFICPTKLSNLLADWAGIGAEVCISEVSVKLIPATVSNHQTGFEMFKVWLHLIISLFKLATCFDLYIYRKFHIKLAAFIFALYSLIQSPHSFAWVYKHFIIVELFTRPPSSWADYGATLADWRTLQTARLPAENICLLPDGGSVQSMWFDWPVGYFCLCCCWPFNQPQSKVRTCKEC